MRARTVKHLIAAGIAVALSVPLTPAVLSAVWLVFPNAATDRVAIVPNRGWMLENPLGPRLVARSRDGRVERLHDYALQFDVFDLTSSEPSFLNLSRQFLSTSASELQTPASSPSAMVWIRDGSQLSLTPLPTPARESSKWSSPAIQESRNRTC
jgi:hypothetical protein